VSQTGGDLQRTALDQRLVLCSQPLGNDLYPMRPGARHKAQSVRVIVLMDVVVSRLA
jgi:hypothetical protein